MTIDPVQRATLSLLRGLPPKPLAFVEAMYGEMPLAVSSEDLASFLGVTQQQAADAIFKAFKNALAERRCRADDVILFGDAGAVSTVITGVPLLSVLAVCHLAHSNELVTEAFMFLVRCHAVITNVS